MKKIYTLLTWMAVMVTATSFVSCDGYLDVTPSNAVDRDGAIANLEDAQIALNGAYYGLITNSYYGNDFIARAEVGGEDVQTISNGKRTENFYRFLYRQNNSPSGLWSVPYSVINRVNVLLAALDSGTIPESDDLNQVRGEALALRALCHFDLLLTYGTPYLKDNGASLGVPLVDKVLSPTDLPSRSTVAQGYAMVLTDLENAKSLMNENVVNGHFNRWAAKALLARVNLHKGDYDAAYTYAKDVVENGPYSLIENKNYVSSWAENFTTESVFELEITNLASGNRELFGYVAHPTGYAAIIGTKDFIDLLNEDPDDVRLGLLQEDSEGQQRFINKYPGRGGATAVNNIRVIRLSDIYLIAAEASLKKSVIDQNVADYCLNEIVKRANPNAPTVTATVNLVLKERRKELVMEGHRLHDILRLGLSVTRSGGYHFLNQVDLQTVSWDDYRCIMPIPQAEVDANPAIKDQQNPGYE